MTVKEFNNIIDTIEYMINEKVIPFMANVLKAIVTLICLSIKAIALILNYIHKITGSESVNAAKKFAKNIRENPALKEDDETIIPANINEAMGFEFSNHYSINKYIQAKLKPELTTNLINMSSYNAPKNRRCKKHHICMGNRCVPREIAALIPSI